ncbi:MAG: glycosyltransferase, partial [Lachnospiraceae bacterium]|nr:glycosyltransferase [Lachnospiraceae bacterium]
MISFIIAVYNNEKYLPNAIESVLKQGMDGVEIVIVDDGSTDRSGFIADQYAEKYNNISV